MTRHEPMNDRKTLLECAGMLHDQIGMHGACKCFSAAIDAFVENRYGPMPTVVIPSRYDGRSFRSGWHTGRAGAQPEIDRLGWQVESLLLSLDRGDSLDAAIDRANAYVAEREAPID